MKRILVTGGAGFIGSHVVRLFVNKYPQYQITNLDALTYAGNLENLRDIEDSPNYSFVKGDITDEAFINALFQEKQFDSVIHLAAESHVDRSIMDPLAFVKTNVLGTAILLNAARAAWKDYNGNWYNHAFLDFAFNEAMTIPTGGTHTDNTVWDGAAHGYADITSENIQVILAVFNNDPIQAYSDPFHEGSDPTWAPFWAYYVDETVAATPQSNSAPIQPNPPSGPTNGVVNVEYTYSGSTTDPNGDDIYYLFDWGDGSDSGWFGPYPSGTTVEAKHTWTYGGTYPVKLKAKDATVDGPWSDPLTVSINGPEILLQNVKGGLFRVSAEIKNTWNEPLSNVNWNITLQGGAFIGKKTSGSNLTIPANSSVTIQSGLILGFGSTHVKVDAYIPDGPSAMIQKSGVLQEGSQKMVREWADKYKSIQKTYLDAVEDHFEKLDEIVGGTP